MLAKHVLEYSKHCRLGKRGVGVVGIRCMWSVGIYRGSEVIVLSTTGSETDGTGAVRNNELHGLGRKGAVRAPISKFGRIDGVWDD